MMMKMMMTRERKTMKVSSITLLSPRNRVPSQQRWRGYSNAAVRLWLGECVGA